MLEGGGGGCRASSIDMMGVPSCVRLVAVVAAAILLDFGVAFCSRRLVVVPSTQGRGAVSVLWLLRWCYYDSAVLLLQW